MNTKSGKNDEDPRVSDLRESWVKNEYTQQASKGFSERLNAAKKVLESACAKSTDADVARAYGAVRELEIDVRFFSKAGA